MMMNEEGSEGEFFFSFWVFLGMRNEREGYPDGGFERRMELAEGEEGGGY